MSNKDMVSREQYERAIKCVGELSMANQELSQKVKLLEECSREDDLWRDRSFFWKRHALNLAVRIPNVHNAKGCVNEICSVCQLAEEIPRDAKAEDDTDQT